MTNMASPDMDALLEQLHRRLDRERQSRIEAEAAAERDRKELFARRQEAQFLESLAAAAATGSVAETLPFVLEQICSLSGWPLGHAYLLRETPKPHLSPSEIWHCRDPDGFDAFCRATRLTRFDPGAGLPGAVMSARGPRWMDDVQAEETFLRRDSAAASGLRAAFAVPVIADNTVQAVLEFFHTEARAVDKDLLHLAMQAGLQLGRVFERQQANDRRVHDAFHDRLTGLPNRALFLDRLQAALLRCQCESRYDFAVLFIDIDRFKVVNDSLGHLAGDSLIQQIAQRLQRALRQQDHSREDAVPRATPLKDTLARLGSDEFCILLEGIDTPEDATRVAERILEQIQAPFAIGSQAAYSSASIGIAMANEGHQAADELLRDADLAMFRAKSLGGARCEFFDEGMHARAIRRMVVEHDIRRALEEKRFVLHFQPIVCLRTGRISGFEALVRWQKAPGELVYPNDFIPVAEDTGLIVPIDLWVLNEACRTLRLWQNDFPREQPLTVSVNLSARLLSRLNLAEQVEDILHANGVEPASVRLEITETMAMTDAERALHLLNQLKAIGVQLSIDDFGTGYSSLNYLHRIPADVLKIDRSFVSQMDDSEECRQIIRTIMNLARSLSMRVIAEGPETETHVEQLMTLDCDYGQGYFFSRPVAAEQARALLQVSPFDRA